LYPIKAVPIRFIDFTFLNRSTKKGEAMSNLTNRALAFLLILSFLAVGLVGCQAQTPTASPTQPISPTTVISQPPTDIPVPPTPTHVPVKLTVWITTRVGQSAADAAKVAIEEWATMTGNQVEVTENEFFELMGKLPVAIPAGEGPDVFMLTNDYVGTFSQGGLLSSIDNALTPEEYAKYTKSAVSAFSLGGHLWGIPVTADINALVYNKALVSEVPGTMDELLTLAKTLTHGDQYGLLYPVDNFWYSYPFFSGFGGYVFKPTATGWDTSDVGFDNAGAIQGLQYVADMVNKLKLMPADVTWDVMNSMFTEGKSAMTIANPSMVPSFKDAGIDVGVTVIPKLSNGEYPRPFATFTGIGVSGHSAHFAESQALVSYLGPKLASVLYNANNGDIPVYADVLNDPVLKNDTELAGWMGQLAHSDPLPSITEINQVWTPALAAFSTVVHGKDTAANAMKSAQTQILEAIAALKK
jgi:maltose-binding protein MalE